MYKSYFNSRQLTKRGPVKLKVAGTRYNCPPSSQSYRMGLVDKGEEPVDTQIDYNRLISAISSGDTDTAQQLALKLAQEKAKLNTTSADQLSQNVDAPKEKEFK